MPSWSKSSGPHIELASSKQIHCSRGILKGIYFGFNKLPVKSLHYTNLSLPVLHVGPIRLMLGSS